MSEKNWSYLVGANLRPVRPGFPYKQLLFLVSGVYMEKLVELDNQSEVATITEMEGVAS